MGGGRGEAAGGPGCGEALSRGAGALGHSPALHSGTCFQVHAWEVGGRAPQLAPGTGAAEVKGQEAPAVGWLHGERPWGSRNSLQQSSLNVNPGPATCRPVPAGVPVLPARGLVGKVDGTRR